MAAVALANSSYKRGSNVPLRVWNMVFEPDPSNAEDGASLVSRPGFTTLIQPNTFNVRGMVRNEDFASGTVYAVTGTSMAAFLPNGLNIVPPVGTIPGTGPCSLAAAVTSGGNLYILIANGAALYKTDTGTISSGGMPDNRAAAMVDYISSRFVIATATTGVEGGRFYWSDVNSPTIQALSYATAETEPDRLIGLKANNGELWLFGASTIEVWQPTGNVDLPFQRINGRSFGIGCLNRATIAKLDAALFWVGALERRVYSTTPNPQIISDAGLEEKLRFADASTINAFTFECDSHSYYVLNMGAQGTMAYDLASQKWSEWGTYGRSDLNARWSASLGDGRYVVASDNGAFKIPDASTYLDDMAPVERAWTGAVDLSASVRCDNIILDCSVGTASEYPPDPQVGLRYSDDQGNNWSDYENIPLGHRGDFSIDVVWRRLGLMRRPGRVFQWKTSAALPFTVRRAKINEVV